MEQLRNYLADIKRTLDLIPLDQVEDIISILQQARLIGQQIFIMGNGGSASTASHFVCDLAKNTRQEGWPGFRVIGLTDNMAIFSAYANDEGYENVFCKQLANLLKPRDVVIAISASGNSLNIVKGVELAKKMGALTIGFTGLTGGKLRELAHMNVHVDSMSMEQVEDIHLMLEHMIVSTIKTIESPVMIPANQIPVLDNHEGNGLVYELFGGRDAVLATRMSKASPDLLQRISQEFAARLDLNDMLTRILGMTVDYVGAASGSIVVLDEDGKVVDGALAYAGEIQDKPTATLNESIQRGLAAWVVENRAPALVENTRQDPRWLPGLTETTSDINRSAICLPLMTQDRVIGVLTLTRPQNNRFTLEDLSLLTSVTLTLSYSFKKRTSEMRRYQPVSTESK